jgi:hypothetical protein
MVFYKIIYYRILELIYQDMIIKYADETKKV